MAFDSPDLETEHKYFGLQWKRGAEQQEQGSLTEQNTKGLEDARLKGNLCPFITPNRTSSLTLLFDFNRKFACLETRVNTGPGSEPPPLVSCWLQIYPKLAGSRVPILQSILNQRLRREFQRGGRGRGLKSGMELNGLGFFAPRSLLRYVTSCLVYLCCN